MRIDVHAHCYPADYLDTLRRYGSDATDVARMPCAGSTGDDIDARLRMMDQAEVDMQLLSATPQLPYFDDPEHAISAARMVNDLYREIVRAHPGRFAALAAAPLPHAEAAAAEIARAMDELGFLGVGISTVVLNRTLGDPTFEPFWAALDRRNAAVFVHAAGTGLDSPLISEHGLTWIVGAPFEDAVGVLHLLRAGVAARHPHIRFIVAHLGGPLPFLMQRIDDNYDQWNEAFPDRPSILLRRMWFDTANFHAPALRCAVASFGADKIMLGSDFPYFRDDLYTRAVRYIAEADLPSEQTRLILDDNAARLFNLNS
ncbi:amidohydrolase [Nonomuraea sp. NN258]|uniref:amidohydrolase family protein n=1 Tax=Nonomuraea antri TaxID=2730852 RepID=UPI001568738E|nr:amidohydrolase family protein [Nonomuraea antri]NRQ34535.1 amidohydrolase [Nonomuraea antri]